MELTERRKEYETNDSNFAIAHFVSEHVGM